MSWDSMLNDTTPWDTNPEPLSPEALARHHQYEAWLAQDIRRRGSMARHAWNAAWAAGRQYEQQKQVD